MRRVFLDVVGPLRRHIGVREDRLNRALGFASSAVDALIGVNVELVVTLVDAVHGTDLDAAGVFGPDAGLSDDVCHGVVLLLASFWEGRFARMSASGRLILTDAAEPRKASACNREEATAPDQRR
jgi:hypothetical protein